MAAPLPTYLLRGGTNYDVELLGAATDGQQLCHNIHFLGRTGVTTLPGGLVCGFLSGSALDETDGRAVLAPLRAAADVAGFRGVDLLLTNKWPEGVDAAAALEGNDAPSRAAARPSPSAARLR